MKKILLFVAIVAGAIYGCSTLNTTQLTSAGGKLLQAATISDEQIEAYVKEFINDSDKKNTVATGSDPYLVRMNKIAKNINGKDGINIKVYKTKDVNAFACADGSVRVYSGLMDIMSDNEILGVIGHEIGHVKLKHTKEAFKTALLASALRDGVTSVGGTVGALSASQLGDLGETIANSKFSQKQEYDADNYGYNFLKNAGANPWAMAMSFEKLQQMEKQAGANPSGPIQQLFSTHPDIAKRTAAMSKRATDEGFKRPAK